MVVVVVVVVMALLEVDVVVAVAGPGARFVGDGVYVFRVGSVPYSSCADDMLAGGWDLCDTAGASLGSLGCEPAQTRGVLVVDG